MVANDPFTLDERRIRNKAAIEPVYALCRKISSVAPVLSGSTIP
jgi:hypothetical protein